jgi:hypothetical protein
MPDPKPSASQWNPLPPLDDEDLLTFELEEVSGGAEVLQSNCTCD